MTRQNPLGLKQKAQIIPLQGTEAVKDVEAVVAVVVEEVAQVLAFKGTWVKIVSSIVRVGVHIHFK